MSLQDLSYHIDRGLDSLHKVREGLSTTVCAEMFCGWSVRVVVINEVQTLVAGEMVGVIHLGCMRLTVRCMPSRKYSQLIQSKVLSRSGGSVSCPDVGVLSRRFFGRQAEVLSSGAKGCFPFRKIVISNPCCAASFALCLESLQNIPRCSSTTSAGLIDI